MVKVKPNEQHEYYMDGYLKNAYETAKKEIKNDWDFIFIYDGVEGSGKSVKAMQDAVFCDPNMTLKQMAWTPETFKTAILNAEKFQSVIYDESHSGLNSRAAMTSVNRNLVSLLTEIRQKNLFVFIVLPTFFDLDKYVALWRSRALIHVYTKNSFERGYFAFYNVDKKKMMYVKGKKFYQYSVVKPNFIGRFTNYYPLDQDEYRKLKYKALKERDNKETDNVTKALATEMLWERIMPLQTLTNVQKTAIMNVSETTFYRKLNEWKEKNDN